MCWSCWSMMTYMAGGRQYVAGGGGLNAELVLRCQPAADATWPRTVEWLPTHTTRKSGGSPLPVSLELITR